MKPTDDRYAMRQESEAMRPPPPVNEWLLHYIDLMESDLRQHANPVGLNRAVKNRALQQRIAEVRAYLSRESS